MDTVLLYVRGAASDYDDWEALGNEGWGFNQLLPCIKKVNMSRSHEKITHNQRCSSKHSHRYRTGHLMVTRARSTYLLVDLTLGSEANF